MKLTTMIGAGLGAMYLGNEGKGETFTSYPNPSRIKQVLGSKINKPETYPGSGQNIYGQKYGRRTPNVDKIMDMVEKTIKSGRDPNPSMAKVIMELDVNDYSGKTAERIFEFQRLIEPKTVMDLMVRQGVQQGQYLNKEQMQGMADMFTNYEKEKRNK